MSRVLRLLELLLEMPEGVRFTVEEMASQFEVSRRTMLRDLQALSAMGVPLTATPGPGGGYTLVRNRGTLPLRFTLDEATSLILSYEGFLEYADSPFAGATKTAVSKIQNALTPELLEQVGKIRDRVMVTGQLRAYEAPLLNDLLLASLKRTHLHIVYDGWSGESSRIIYPYGLYATDGFWYCAAYDYKRQTHVSLRADRFKSIAPTEHNASPPEYSIQEWVQRKDSDEEPLQLEVYLTESAIKYADLSWLVDSLTTNEDGSGHARKNIRRTDVAMWARYFLRLGTEAKVVAPEVLVREIQRRIVDLHELYNK